ncbi:ClpP/crotonase [Exidia glandulosa HHB12029]|uniref:3-hydroxyisobutyryl-CoA hydrolase n=1 Tax=Exidia glandulosa HHB12029 TaxID=1314781 RepID=A0A165KE67_EXIGL|nr:ClpP/crotonase [Exidia glandulosa HHB12029]
MLRNHLATAATPADEAPVIFENDRSIRSFILNRPKLNPLDEEMIDLISAKLKEWDNADLCRMIIGRGSGRAFCAGGNVKDVVKDAADKKTRHRAIDFFRKEFLLDFQTATLKKPYIAILDGITMGGGVGLSINAAFRIATEKTVLAMPETKIGYCPDVGASYFLSRLDGEVGTYLALTGNSLTGREVFKYGLATHYTASRRIPDLLNTLASLESAGLKELNTTIEEFYEHPYEDEPGILLEADVRIALDSAFAGKRLEDIIERLEWFRDNADGRVADWAELTLYELHMRSPTSLRVALEAIRRGRSFFSLSQALHQEFAIACAYINGASPDFKTGVTSKLELKLPDEERIAWEPNTVAECDNQKIVERFFNFSSPFLKGTPMLDIEPPTEQPAPFMRFSLPSEHYVESVVRGTDRNSGTKALTAAEVVKRINETFDKKNGVTEKVEEIIARKCEVLEDPDRYGCIGWVTEDSER